jgi:hypothetical protein
MVGDFLAALGFLAALAGATEVCLALASLTLCWCVVTEAEFGR